MHISFRSICAISLLLTLAACDAEEVLQETEPAGQSAPAITRVAMRPSSLETSDISAQEQQTTPIPEDVQAQLDAEEQIVANVFDRYAPAVVRISSGQGLGSGFLIDTNGYIITNNHVIASSRNGQVLVAFSGLFETIGSIVGTDPDSDIAVVKVDQLPQRVTPVVLGDSNKVRVGQRTIAIGNPLGQDRTVTTGIVSAIGRTIQEEQSLYRIGGAIQTDAAINPGNSGGPLFNSRGQVIGMNTAILSGSGTSSGVGFAVPVNLIKKVASVLIERGRYDHPWMGVQLADISTLVAEQERLPSAGVLIEPSERSSPVARAGLRGQAILIAIDGVMMTSSDEVISFLELETRPGDVVTITIMGDDGQQRELQVELGSRPRVEDAP